MTEAEKIVGHYPDEIPEIVAQRLIGSAKSEADVAGVFMARGTEVCVHEDDVGVLAEAGGVCRCDCGWWDDVGELALQDNEYKCENCWEGDDFPTD